MRAVLCLAIGLVGCVDSNSKGPETTGGGPEEPLTALPAPTANVTHAQLPIEPSISLSSSVQLLDAGVTSTSFNFAHLGLLWVRVSLPGMGRTTTVTLKLISPRGNLMYDADLPFSTDSAVKTIRMAHVPHPVVVHPVKQSGGIFHLDYPIAVAGSALTKYPDPGPWQLTALVADTGQTLTVGLDVTVAQ
jgi:hypothetical protein